MVYDGAGIWQGLMMRRCVNSHGFSYLRRKQKFTRAQVASLHVPCVTCSNQSAQSHLILPTNRPNRINKPLDISISKIRLRQLQNGSSRKQPGKAKKQMTINYPNTIEVEPKSKLMQYSIIWVLLTPFQIHIGSLLVLYKFEDHCIPNLVR